MDIEDKDEDEDEEPDDDEGEAEDDLKEVCFIFLLLPKPD